VPEAVIQLSEAYRARLAREHNQPLEFVERVYRRTVAAPEIARLFADVALPGCVRVLIVHDGGCPIPIRRSWARPRRKRRARGARAR
jgi:hypothetical protein